MAQGNTTGISVDIDGTLSTDSNLLIPSQKAVKTYVDSKVSDSITDGVTTIAPSQNAVFDALALKQDKSRYLYQGFTTVIGVTTPTIAISLLIPANTYAATDGFEIIVNINKSTTATAVNYNLYHDTTINGTTNAIATAVSLGTTNRGSAFQRVLNLNGGNAYNNLAASSASLTTFLTASASPTITTFNPAVDQYITLQISGLTVVSESSSVTMSIRPLKG